MINPSSGYDSFDQLNRQAALASGGQTPVRRPSGFSSALNSISQLLTTATSTIVTVDGVINKEKAGDARRSLYPGQHAAPAPEWQGNSLMRYLAIAGLAAGGGLIAMKTLKK